MKVSTILASALGLASTVFAESNSRACSKKNPSVLNAIGQFCQNRHMQVPSKYAEEGKWSDDSNVWITISGTCSPIEIVGWDTCFDFFYAMCAVGLTKRTGIVEEKTGHNGCQSWTLVANA